MISFLITVYCLVTLISGQGEKENYGEWHDTTWNEYPFMALIDFACGGSIISLSGNNGKGVILTAAHCIKNEEGVIASSADVYIGCTKSNCGAETETGDDSISEGKKYRATSFMVHESYDPSLAPEDPNWNNNDVALIFLDEAIAVPGAKAVAIHNTMNVIKNNDAVKTLGYYGICGGDRDECLGGSDTDTLEYELTHFMETNECVAAEGTQVAGPHEFCVKDDEPDNSNKFTSSCGGDSGSPLIFKDKQIGLVSFGDAFCDPAKPSMATSVPYYYNWIKSKCAACILILNGTGSPTIKPMTNGPTIRPSTSTTREPTQLTTESPLESTLEPTELTPEPTLEPTQEEIL